MPPKDPTIEEAEAFRSRARPASRDPGPPMTLGNMRANGVRSIAAWCGHHNCEHQVVFNVDHMPDAVEVAFDRTSHGVHTVRPCRCRRAAELELIRPARWRGFASRRPGRYDPCYALRRSPTAPSRLHRAVSADSRA